jgi:hypothetical protein
MMMFVDAAAAAAAAAADDDDDDDDEMMRRSLITPSHMASYQILRRMSLQQQRRGIRYARCIPSLIL